METDAIWAGRSGNPWEIGSSQCKGPVAEASTLYPRKLAASVRCREEGFPRWLITTAGTAQLGQAEPLRLWPFSPSLGLHLHPTSASPPTWSDLRPYSKPTAQPGSPPAKTVPSSRHPLRPPDSASTPALPTHLSPRAQPRPDAAFSCPALRSPPPAAPGGPWPSAHHPPSQPLLWVSKGPPHHHHAYTSRLSSTETTPSGRGPA